MIMHHHHGLIEHQVPLSSEPHGTDTTLCDPHLEQAEGLGDGDLAEVDLRDGLTSQKENRDATQVVHR